MMTTCALDFASILAGRRTRVHLVSNLRAPKVQERRTSPVSFALVLDRSVSMSGDSLRAARAYISLFVKNLYPGDWFGLVAFSDTAYTVIPPAPQRPKRDCLRSIRNMTPGGSTDLTSGWRAGREALLQAPPRLPRRLLLLTDGLANVGITDPVQIQSLVTSGLNQDGIRTSCLGFGDDYDEDLLAALAELAGGRFYDANRLDALPRIVQGELEESRATSVQNVRLEIEPSSAVRSLQVLDGSPTKRLEPGGIAIQIGDLLSDEERTVVVALLLAPMLPSPDAVHLLDVRILGEIVREGGTHRVLDDHVVRIHPVASKKHVQKNPKMTDSECLPSSIVVPRRAIELQHASKWRQVQNLLRCALGWFRVLPRVDLVEGAVNLLERAGKDWRRTKDSRRPRKLDAAMVTLAGKTSSKNILNSESGDMTSFKRSLRSPTHRSPGAGKQSSAPQAGSPLSNASRLSGAN